LFARATVLSLKATQQALPDKVPNHAQNVILEDCRSLIGDVVVSLDKPEATPRAVLQLAVSKLGRVEAKSFVLQNLLEALKRGESLQNVPRRYADLGLSEAPQEPDEEEQLSGKQIPPSSLNAAWLIRRLQQALADVGVALINMVMNAIKHIPSLAKIKPRPIVGVSGFFPTLALSLDLEASSISGSSPK
jgi:hypothetical protein